MVWADWVVRAFALFGVVVFSWQVGKYGIRYVMTEIAGWFSVAKNDFVALEARVKEFEAWSNSVEQRLKSIGPQSVHTPAATDPKAA